MTQFPPLLRVPVSTDSLPTPSTRRRRKAAAGGLTLGLLLCGQAAENQAPLASLGLAIQGSSSSSSVITLLGTATDPDGQVHRVDFYEGEQWLATAWAPPFNLEVRALNQGPFDWTFRLIATDDQGAESAVSEATNHGRQGELSEQIVVEEGVRLWLRADRGVSLSDAEPNGVIAWMDQSPSGHQAGPLGNEYSPTGTEQPILFTESFIPFLRFDGQDDVLEIPNSPSLRPETNDWTVFFVARRGAAEPPVVSAQLIGSPAAGNPLNPAWGVTLDESGRLGYHWSDAAGAEAEASSVSSLSAERFQIWQLEADRAGNRIRFFRNGTLDAAVGVTMPAGEVSPSSPVHLGRDPGVQGGANVDLGELIVFGRVLSDAERDSVTGWLAGRYGLNALVVTNRLPTVSLTAPAAGAELLAGEEVTLIADARDPGGSVLSVEFFAGDQTLGLVTRSPFQITTSQLPAGTILLTALVTDNFGAQVTSAVVQVSVVAPAPILRVAWIGNEIELTWDGSATLETSAALNGTWSPASSATSPHRVGLTEATRLFRLRP